MRAPVRSPLLCLLLATLLCTLLGACSPSAPPPQEQPAPETPSTPDAAPAAQEDRPTVLFLGDSLAAGYGLSEEQAFPALVGERLREEGLEVDIVNAGVSGDTTAGGLARIDWLLRQEPEVVVVELGANDGLRGLDPSVTEENLRQILQRCRAAGARVVLAGMQMPPNYGADFQQRFADLYPKLAAEFSVPLIPFLLEGVAAEPSLNLPDGIHPNEEGQQIVAATVTPFLAEVLSELNG